MSKKDKALRQQMKAQAAARRILIVKVVVVVAAIALAFVGLPILLVSSLVMAVLLRWPDRLYARGAMLLGIIPAVAGLALLGSYWRAYTAVISGDGSTSDVLATLVYALAFGPLLGGITARVFRRRREAHPLKGQQRTQARTKLEDSRKRHTRQWIQAKAYEHAEPSSEDGQVSRAQVVRTAVMRRAAVPLGSDRGPYLGAWLRGDLSEMQSKSGRYGEASWTYGGMGPHYWVAGQSGSGKSELVHRLTEWPMAYVPRGQVIRIDGKQTAAGKEASRRLLAHAEALGMSSNVLVKGYAPYDFMRGTPAQVRNRLMDIEVFTEPHHQAGTTVALAFALNKLDREGRPAASLPDVLREMIDRRQIQQWAATDPNAAKLLDMVDENSWKGTVQRYAANAMDLAGWAGPPAQGGFAFEDAQLTCVDLPIRTEPQTARMLLRMLLSDLNAYLDSDRRPKMPDGEPVPLTLVIEELSAADSDPVIGRIVTNLMESMRSSRGKAVVVTQDWHGLGELKEQTAVAGHSTVITFRQAVQYEEFADLAGTEQVAEASGTYTSRWRAGDSATSGSLRMQETYGVHPNELRRLGLGECFVMRGGRYAKVAVTMSELGYRMPQSARVREVDRQRADSGSQPSGPDGTINGQERPQIGEDEL